jgi:mutual gliding-motility protein MglA
MVFFNYSTMQVAAKIVYYGPGLCGKTTNLQYIYDHTTGDSRGEMVSLQTETDRTLFFDLLPIDLGSIGGFKTKIQLYTVPGQVFYNTTRKLVLKGVDGVVFVADSQRLMLDANIDSLANLETNLAEIGFKITDLPVVIQYNKRDLPDVSALHELQAALNQAGLPNFEACALSGQGVFETLTGIAKLTLASLRDRLTAGRTSSRPQASPVAPRPQRKPAPPSPPSRPPLLAPAAPATGSAAAPARPQPAPAATGSARSAPAGASAAAAVASVEAPPVAAANGHLQMSRDLALQVPRGALARARRVSVSLRLEDDQKNVVGDLQQGYDLDANPSLKELLLRLQVSVTPRDEPGG